MNFAGEKTPTQSSADGFGDTSFTVTHWVSSPCNHTNEKTESTWRLQFLINLKTSISYIILIKVIKETHSRSVCLQHLSKRESKTKINKEMSIIHKTVTFRPRTPGYALTIAESWSARTVLWIAILERGCSPWAQLKLILQLSKHKNTKRNIDSSIIAKSLILKPQ